MTSGILFVIPARGGSKGIPGKNIKPLGGKPLLHYSIEYARQFVPDGQICLTTDSEDIMACARKIGYECQFARPAFLATDEASSYEVIQHALSIYDPGHGQYKIVVLLQPTSPFREKFHLQEALAHYTEGLDMVVSVAISDANPYYTLFEENAAGFLEISKGDGQYTRRQDVPPVYLYNGSLYIINAQSLKDKRTFSVFSKVKKYVMDAVYSIDLDTPDDWLLAEFMLKNRIRHEYH